MVTLLPCASCARHIRDDEARCPFCGSEERPASLGQPAASEGAVLSRAARMAFRAAVTTVTLATACSSDPPPDNAPKTVNDVTPPPVETTANSLPTETTAATSETTATATATATAATSTTASAASASASTAKPTGTPAPTPTYRRDHNSIPRPYGAPPARPDRVV